MPRPRPSSEKQKKPRPAPAKRRPNIFDLEKVTGLSRGTISRAFNDRAEINPATREFVLRKAAEIGYSPHPGARMIRLGRTGRWGLLLPQLRNPWYAELTEALDHEARRSGTMLMLGLSHYDPALERQFIRYWAAGEVDGIVVSSIDSDANYEEVAQFYGRGFPIVYLYGAPQNAFDVVTVDVRENVTRVLQHLYDLGHRRIGYASHDYRSARCTPQFEAYEAFLLSAGLPLREDWIHFDPVPWEAGAHAWARWKDSPHRPTAAFCAGDDLACGMANAVRASGLQVPRDLSVVGVDGISESEETQLTTLRIDRSAFAAAVFELLQRPRGDDQPARICRTIPSELVLRESVAPPPQAPVLPA